ncbi:MAG: hypothetical protein ACRD2Z_09835 [Thermoanaerobaculia bacterium]
MRTLLAILAALAFAIVGGGTYLLTRTVAVVGDAQRVAALVDDTGAYELTYDQALEAALADALARDSGGTAGVAGDLGAIAQNDPATTAATLKEAVEAVLPREFLQAQVQEALTRLGPYLIGQADEFTLEADVAERIRTAPPIVASTVGELGVGRILATRVIAPRLVERFGDLDLDRLGIRLTEATARDIALRVLPPAWIERALVSTAEEIAPYLAGDTTSFAVRIPLADRVVALAELLKDEVAGQAAAGNFAFGELAGTTIERRVGGSAALGYGIEVTAEEIIQALDRVTPPEWLAAQAGLVIDRLAAYLTGDSDELAVTIGLSAWNERALAVLFELAEERVTRMVESLPPCRTPEEFSAAGADIAARRAPRCAGPEVEALLPVVLPLIRMRMEQIAEDLPSSLTYTDAMSRQELGPERLGTLERTRDQIVNGLVWTDRELLAGLGRDGGARDEAESALQRIRDGFRYTDQDLRRDLGADAEHLESFRGTARFAQRHRYALYALSLGLLLAAAFAGGRTWSGRAIWAGGVLFVASGALLLALYAAEAAGASRVEDAAGNAVTLDPDTRASFPRLAQLLDGGAATGVAVRAWHALAAAYRAGVTPFLIAGAALLLAAAATRMIGRRAGGRQGDGGGP